MLEEVRERYIGDPAFSNLPRKFKTSISGCSVHCTNHEINDVAFVGVRLPDGRSGYDLWVGGGLSTNPKLGRAARRVRRAGRVAEVWAGVASVFRDYGYRRSRMHARLKFLLADWGPEKFREVLEEEYLDRAAARRSGARDAADAGARPRRRARAERRPQLRRRRAARRPHQRPAAAARRRAGRAVRRRPGVDDGAAGAGGARRGRGARRAAGRLPGGRGPARAAVACSAAGTLACTGLEFCKLAIVETKARSVDLYAELEKRLPDFDEPLTINVNGCPNSCARFQTGDIGLKGSIVDGVEGFQVHLGGWMGEDAGFGRKSRGLKVTADGAADYVERLLRTYLERPRPTASASRPGPAGPTRPC